MRISGVEIPDNERAEIGLTRFFGIGRTNVIKLLELSKISADIFRSFKTINLYKHSIV